MSFYLFIAISFYLFIEILCAKILCAKILCELGHTRDILAHNIAIKRQKDIVIKRYF
jgi:hypothetical protein